MSTSTTRVAYPAPSGPTLARRPTRVRWVVCLLLFLATSINYVDRQVLGILAPTLQTEIGWSESQYGLIVTSFTLAYAIGLLAFGRALDRIGTRVGYAVAVIWWSIAAMAHALARTPMGFAAARFGLGLGEAGNFPAALKVVAEWFPKRERALAVGLFNGGSNVGAVVAPLLVPWIALTYGWRWAFILTGALGLAWLIAWWWLYRSPEGHPRVSAEELDLIRSDPPEAATPVAWSSLFGRRETWAFALGKFMTDPIWWFYLYWLPKFLHDSHGVTLGNLALPLVLIYLFADVGSIGGGWISSMLIRRGWSVHRGREAGLILCALAAVPVAFVPLAPEMGAVALVALAAAAHQGWSANLFTSAADTLPRHAVASVVGIGGFMGAVGGMLFQSATGYYLEWSGSAYGPIFLVCGAAYVSGWGLRRLLLRSAPDREQPLRS